ncbi:MAG: hypothetical protein K5739_09665 [Lachnospiraceae bacterium]|nr:hypothetical protein [Lachnospiraceae bacterium]
MIRYPGERNHRNERGAAMVVVVCVMMVLMILALTMIAGAYQTVASVRDGRRDVGYYQQAYSFCEMIRSKVGDGNAKSVPAHPADLYEQIICFAADETLFGDDTKPVEMPEKQYDEVSRSTGAGSESFGSLQLRIRKKRAGTDKCRLFLTVNINEEDKKMASCTIGFDVVLGTDAVGKTCKMDFRSYY